MKKKFGWTDHSHPPERVITTHTKEKKIKVVSSIFLFSLWCGFPQKMTTDTRPTPHPLKMLSNGWRPLPNRGSCLLEVHRIVGILLLETPMEAWGNVSHKEVLLHHRDKFPRMLREHVQPLEKLHRALPWGLGLAALCGIAGRECSCMQLGQDFLLG
jgi:hypothetical protein